MHEDVAADISQLCRHVLAVGIKLLCHVKAVIEGAHGFGLFRTAHQSNRLAGHAKADGHFRADRDEVEVIREGAATQPRFLVPTVVAHVEPHQAGADGYFRFGGRVEHRNTSNLNLYKPSGLYKITSS
ncbi:hypothetical protein D3C84_1002640 [compost metagenome]